MSHQPEAVIIAGGFGTRLLPLTAHRPKHLLNVGGVPFLEHQVARLAAAGVEHVVLATSYRAEAFEPVLGDGRRWGVALEYVQEEEPLGTAGAIRNVAGSLRSGPGDPVIVLNGDILSSHDLRAQLQDFATPRSGREVEVCLHLVEVSDARAFGCVPTDAAGRVTGFIEKSEHPVTNQVNAGCYIFRREVLDTIPSGRAVSVERETFPALVAEDRLVVGYVDTAYWRDVGTPAALVAASRDLVLGRAASPAVPAGPAAARVLDGAVVDPGAEVLGGSVVEAGAWVGPGARIDGSVVMAGAVVAEDALVVDSVIGPDAVVGRAARLTGVTLGDEATVSAGGRLEAERVDCAVQV
jgi:mannose-1-phosphate guanylyltransferase